jgi:hypothetical protein
MSKTEEGNRKERCGFPQEGNTTGKEIGARQSEKG